MDGAAVVAVVGAAGSVVTRSEAIKSNMLGENPELRS